MYPGTFGTFVPILAPLFLRFFTGILVVLDVFRVSKPIYKGTFGTFVFFRGDSALPESNFLFRLCKNFNFSEFKLGFHIKHDKKCVLLCRAKRVCHVQ